MTEEIYFRRRLTILAEPYGLEPEVLKAYHRYRESGFQPKQAACCACWDFELEAAGLTSPLKKVGEDLEEPEFLAHVPKVAPPEERVQEEITEALEDLNKEYETENSVKNPEAFNRLKADLSTIWHSYVKEIYKDDKK